LATDTTPSAPTDDILWEDPPPHARRPGTRKGGKYGPFADRLRANPGKSAKLGPFPTPDGARAFANGVEHGRKAGFKNGVWEAAVHEEWVWVTYIRADDDPTDGSAATAVPETGDDDGPEPPAVDG
jgi:hypothetical protein